MRAKLCHLFRYYTDDIERWNSLLRIRVINSPVLLSEKKLASFLQFQEK